MGQMELISQSATALMPLRAGVTQIVVARAYGVTLDEMCAATRRTSQTAFARQVAMYLAHIVFSISINDVAQAFARDRSTVCYAVQRVEALREDPDFDHTLGWLESVVRAVAERL
ncbi:MAG TPA: helix-turn-helix domain-containing protein [Rhizomicrobium sp.]|nr:helix-turn-helix domain-containing protein [Rhizomicrobium sp.]